MDDELVAAVYDKAGPRVAKRPISGQADHAPPPRKKRAVVRGPPSLNIASFALLGSQVLRSPPEPPQEDSDDTQSSTPPKSPSGHRNRPCPSDEEDNPLIEHLPKGVDSNLTGQAEEVPVPGEEAFPDAVAERRASANRICSAFRPSADISVQFDINDVLSSWKRHLGPVTPRKGGQLVDIGNSAKVPSDAGVHNSENDAKAAEALSRVIDKSDFASMDILGQFNLGFIICRRRKSFRESFSTMDDLFIVDQHASDEKYNFESLQLTTKIQSQKLLRLRLPLELTAADELVASENLQVLKDNGFEVHVAPDNDTCGARLQLTAQPVSKNTLSRPGLTERPLDLEELIHLLRDTSSGTMVRCSKARAMFASRACRKSVMVGMALNQTQMTTVVRHMGTIDQPWNCPHGRPTMRHLADIASVAATAQNPSSGLGLVRLIIHLLLLSFAYANIFATVALSASKLHIPLCIIPFMDLLSVL
ncbi:hypothetical protein FA13DRAFT_1635946 [Coprinellus micaceus]|uniref:MutL C-terminal dimerisation domain-containing protein n=1 Tax=Coprinellus micaceus TaxID=71717 RepID=A0A4Y7SX07_COPMI|nr:hypothetical protein FA13DRAFT_1635946 [Coprinellus micaceus]